MGIALEKLGASQCADIAADLFTVKNTNGDEQVGLCPFHDDKNPSFSYNSKKDVFNCHACNASGDLVNLYAHVRGYSEGDGFKAFCREFDIKLEGGSSNRPPGAPPPPKSRKKKTDNNDPEPLDKVFSMMPPLTPDWIAWLKRHRGWSKEVIEQLDIRLQTHYQAKGTGEIKKLKGKPKRLAIPIRDTDGHIRNIRLYKPADRKKDELKIISWGKGYGATRLFPPAPDPELSPVFLCEGEADTICALSQGLNAITQTSKPKKWARDHAEMFENLDVIIAYDADQAGEHYAIDFATPALARVVRSLKKIEWPDEMGRQSDGLWPEKGGQDFTDFFIKHRKTIDDFWLLVDAAPVIDVLPHVSAQAREFFSLNMNDTLVFRPRLLAEKVLTKFQVLLDPDSGLLYRWNGRFWQSFQEEHLKSLGIKMLGDESLKNRIEDAVYQVKNLSPLPDGRKVNDQKDLTCVKNGMLDLLTWKMFPHKKDYYATFELNVTVDPESDRKCRRWLSFLSQNIQTPAVIMQVQEFFGYCLTRDCLYGKSLFLVGPGADGKSTLIKILRDMVGPDNTSSISFSELEDQFLRASLYQKAVNFSTETQSFSLESEYFKKIATGDPINAAFKHKNSFEFIPFCKLVFSANRLPRVSDNSDGFYRRVLPVMFKRQFLEDDPDTDPALYYKLQAELSEIFIWSLVGLKRLIDQGRFTDCDETRDAVMDYRRLNNPVLCFIDDMCVLGETHEADKKALYTSYREYCQQNGYKRLSNANFFRELYATKDNLYNSRPRDGNGGRLNLVRGIDLRFDANSGE
ncbi:MAG: phage/plasmid primase, P4 family [Thermodesulfobacteriota bacterium]|nr:phage/plasmid primase, P4 family [Thermodesulfobacteriota bacterium]